MTANMLQPLRASIYAFKTDFVIASWIARVQPDELNTAPGCHHERWLYRLQIRNSDDTPRDVSNLTEPIDVLLDVEPRTPETINFPGRSYDQHGIIGPMLKRR